MPEKPKYTARQIEIAEQLKAAPKDGTEWIKHLPPVPPLPSKGVKVVVLLPNAETGKDDA